MNNNFIRNFILGLIVSIGLFTLIGLSGYCSTFKTINLKHSSTTYDDNIHKCTVTFSTPTFTGQSVKDPNTSYTGSNYQVVYYNVIVTTSEGTFTIKSGSGSIQFSDYNTDQTFNLGLTGLGSYNLPGYFINASLEYTSGNDVYGGGIFGQESSTGYITGNYNKKPNEVLINSVNSNFVSFTNGTFSDSNEYPVTTFQSNSYYAHYNAIDQGYLDSNNSVYRSGSVLTFDHIINNHQVTFDYITLRLHAVSGSGVDSVISVYNADYSTFNSLTNNSVIFNLSNSAVTLNYCPTVFYYEYTVYGATEPFLTFTNPLNSGIYFIRYVLNPLNVYDTREAADWKTIEDSDELENFNNTSVSMNEIISDNNDTFNDDYSDYDDYISRVDLSGSKTKFNELVAMPKIYLNAFYNGLPDDIKGFIRIILNIGLAMMVLTVGTRVMRYRGN